MTTMTSQPSLEDFADFSDAYVGFGSFFSEDVEELIRKPSAEYVAPTVPDFATLEDATKKLHGHELGKLADFGSAFRKKHFSIDESYTFVNHGAFGGALREGMLIKQSYEDHMEKQLLSFMDRHVLPAVVKSTRQIADRLLHCSPEDVVLVPNATYGLNCAISSFVHHGDVVVFLDTEYLSVFKMLQERCELLSAQAARSGGALKAPRLVELPIEGLLHSDILADDAKFIDHITSFIPRETTIIVLDHITSTSAIQIPVFDLIPRLRKTLPKLRHVIVDGAHGAMQVPLDFSALASDQLPSCYVTNLHKWFSAPKSVGCMWVRHDLQDQVRPVVVSHGAGKGFLSDFIWDGTKDYGAILSLPALLDFWFDHVGYERVSAHCSNLHRQASQMLTTAFKSEKVARGSNFMSLIQLPPFFQRFSKYITPKYIQEALHNTYHVEVPVKNIRGRLYLRISFFVNNEMSDYERLRDAVMDLQEKMTASVLRRYESRIGQKRDRGDSAWEHAPMPETPAFQPMPLEVPISSPAPVADQGAAIPDTELVPTSLHPARPDPNCNGCGIGSLGAAPKKTRKF